MRRTHQKPLRTPHRLGLQAGLLGLLVACAAPPSEVAETGTPDPAAWQPLLLPGKRATQYRAGTWQGRAAIEATADGSASLWRRRLDLAPERLGHVEFSWWVAGLPRQATVSDPDRADAPARLVLAFEGDDGTLSARNRMLFELARMLSGEAPPYATLMYVWDATEPVGSLVVDGRSDRVRKLVVDSGPEHLGGWRTHRRDLRADFRRAFGEEPGRLVGVALMTDGDNTNQRLRAWYGDVKFN